jgi:hypothetical protein
VMLTLLNSTTKITALLFTLLIVAASEAKASQYGVPFPSHRFPTDTSFHATYSFGLGSTSSNYSNAGTEIALAGEQKVSWIKNTVQLEYQPSNHFSFGGNFTFQRTAIDAGNLATFPASWSLGDQTIFAEYRFIDGSGYSLGLSGIIKFPGYQNDGIEEAQAKGYSLLPGDAQTDFGGLLSAELWPTRTIRVQGDFGYLVRTQDFANQLLYQGSVGFVIPRVDASFRMIGYHSIGNGPVPGSSFESEISTVQGLFGGSSYAYSPTPSLLMISPKVEFWIGPEYAASFTLTRTIMGTNSAKGSLFEVGFTYRFTERKQNTRRNFTEVDIGYDHNDGVFEGELQERNRSNLPSRPGGQRQDFDFEPLYYEPAE